MSKDKRRAGGLGDFDPLAALGVGEGDEDAKAAPKEVAKTSTKPDEPAKEEVSEEFSTHTRTVDTARINFLMPIELHERAKNFASTSGAPQTSVTAIINTAVRNYLEIEERLLEETRRATEEARKRLLKERL